MSALVASAIRNLREIRGSTSKEIMNYIKSQYTGSDSNIQKQIFAALKRGLDYGILKRDRGYYSLNTDPDMMYKAHTVPPMEQGRPRRDGRRRQRRNRNHKRRPSRRGRRRRRGVARRRARARRRGRRSRSSSRRRRRNSFPIRSRSLATARCKCETSRKRTEGTARNSPVEDLRKDMTYLYKKGISDQTPSRHQSRSRDRSQTHSRSSSSDKEMIDDQNRDQS
ncbi:hypothetical protein ALC56_01746 [Trachymyrmex septentrionalis]|uniref:H15 domain-containing protein n=2 Tax=Trachymyrmex septentrionalis TaxID=34720 RepID=A0A195FTD6_9HYME|nr:hypothetical protein ALC56_01746 [Trachymyrmex septentrionalis]